jgi:hypothetical protein
MRREHLDTVTRADEAFALALRTRRGAVPPPGTAPEVADLTAAGLLTPATPVGDRVTLTRRGRLLATAVTVRLLAAAPAPPRTPIGTR